MPASSPQLFLKEHLHQLLESMREHVLNLAAVTLQSCLRGFFIRRRFRSLRRKIILLQSRARGYLARYSPDTAGLPGGLGLGEAWERPYLNLGSKPPGLVACKLRVGASAGRMLGFSRSLLLDVSPTYPLALVIDGWECFQPRGVPPCLLGAPVGCTCWRQVNPGPAT